MSKANKQVLLTVPCMQQDQGGVAGFYNGVLPHFPPGKVVPLEIGGTKNTGGLFHPLVDQIRFYKAVRKVKPALIHLNPSLITKSFFRDGLFAWQAKRMGYPLLVFWRGWGKQFEAVVDKRYLGFFRRTFGRADGSIVLASKFERTLRKWGVESPVYLETTGVDENLLSNFSVHDKWGESKQLAVISVLHLARLTRSKGAFETVQAVKYLLDKELPVFLTISGDGEIREELEEFTRSLNLSSDQVHFTGDVRGEEKIRVLTEHQIYCFPTFFGEGMPNSVLEAMAFGMPVITRPVGGLADFFEDGKMGFMVQGTSPEEIASCLEKIIIDRDKMEEMGKYNAEYAQEHFVAPVVAKRLLSIYESIPGTSLSR